MMPVLGFFVFVDYISQILLFLSVHVRTIAHHQDALVVVESASQTQLIGLEQIRLLV